MHFMLMASEERWVGNWIKLLLLFFSFSLQAVTNEEVGNSLSSSCCQADMKTQAVCMRLQSSCNLITNYAFHSLTNEKDVRRREEEERKRGLGDENQISYHLHSLVSISGKFSFFFVSYYLCFIWFFLSFSFSSRDHLLINLYSHTHAQSSSRIGQAVAGVSLSLSLVHDITSFSWLPWLGMMWESHD